jgi:hypothetical protein
MDEIDPPQNNWVNVADLSASKRGNLNKYHLAANGK